MEKGEVFKISDPSIYRASKNKEAFINTEDDYVIKSIVFNNNGRKAIIPLPDLTLVYFDSAYNLNILRKEQEINLFNNILNKDDELKEVELNEIYRYYGYSSSCIISLFTSLESFINHILPDLKPYVKKHSHKTEFFDKEQIQKGIKFDVKTKDVLPFYFDGKSYFKSPSKHTQHIMNLKNLRDEIVHPKSEITFKNQEELVKKLLKFNYDDSFKAVAHFMNFYKTDYIKECDCNADF